MGYYSIVVWSEWKLIQYGFRVTTRAIRFTVNTMVSGNQLMNRMGNLFSPSQT